MLAKVNGNDLQTVECSICHAVRGEDYEHYADHLYAEHGPEDVGLAPVGEVQEPRKVTV